MKIPSGGNALFMEENDSEKLFPQEMNRESNEGIQKLRRSGITDQEVLQRAREREDEERDLLVLDTYNRFEAGLREIMTAPESGILHRHAGAAQTSIFEINDYFTEEGGKLRDQLPDEPCRSLFMDILKSRRKTAINAVARYQSREYQKWKDSTAAMTIDSILKSVNMSPDAASIIHGEQLLEGTIMRLYRSAGPELLAVKLNTARQAMYCGALESIAAGDPITATIVLESWKEQLNDDNYEFLRKKFEPLARNQNLKMEFNALHDLEGDILEAELQDIADQQMRDELAEMIIAERLQRRAAKEKSEVEQVNIASRKLFQLYFQGKLKMGDIIDSGLSAEQRSLWRKIFSSEGAGDDRALLQTVKAIIDSTISEEHNIYEAVAEGLGKADASMLAGLFGLRDNPEARIMNHALRELGEACSLSGGEETDHAAAVRDLLNRVMVKAGKGEIFSLTALRNEVIKDHFSTLCSKSSAKQPLIREGKDEQHDPQEAVETESSDEENITDHNIMDTKQR